jgi:glycosyltransferase involved in cell wall biosynthesis
VEGVLPLVSCVLPTYNRFPERGALLGEAVESFLRQDYPRKELIVLNDTPGQALSFDHPEVRVVNAQKRFASLGAKRNAGMELAAGELVCPWDDDDIAFPWRISLSVERLGDADFFLPDSGWEWYEPSQRLDRLEGNILAQMMFRKDACAKIGGYPDITYGEDYELYTRFYREARHATAALSRAEMFYVYRRHVQPDHVTFRSWEEIGARPIAPGAFCIEPRWSRDWLALAAAAGGGAPDQGV